MIDFKMLVENESLLDVIVSLIGVNGFRYISLDRIYTQYKPSVHETSEFRDAIKLLVFSQAISVDKMRVYRGVNWHPPKFRLEKKYGFK